MILLLLACTSTGTDIDDSDKRCSAALSPAISLVIGVDWTPTSTGESYIEYGETEDYGQRTPSTADPEVHLALLGNPPDTNIYWRAVTEGANGREECLGVTRTGILPADLPVIHVTTDERADQSEEKYFLGGFFTPNGTMTRMLALRRDGEVVWYYQGNDNGTTVDLHYDVTGRGLIYNVFDRSVMGSEDNTIRLISLSGEPLESWDTPLAQHMFTQLPDGTLTYQAIDTRPYTEPDGTTADWVGDALVEVAPTGERKTIFSTWDWLPPRRNIRMTERGLYDGLDWTHGNFVHYEVDRDRYMLSLGHADDVMHVSREGEMSDLFGADGQPAEPIFEYQHNPVWLDDTHLLMFMTNPSGSGAIEYERGDDDVLQEVWQYGFKKTSFALGQAIRLKNGNILVNFGAMNTLQEVTPSGTVVWQANGTGSGPTSSLFGQFQAISDLYTGQ